MNWLIRPNRHRGVDYVAPQGTPVLASQKGLVTKAYLKPRVGWIVRIFHAESGFDTRYLHMASASVKPGQRVERGQEIGKVGLFHHSAGVEHVHLELYRHEYDEEGKRVNVIADPATEMAGCFRSAAHPVRESALSYPIPCTDSWSDKTRPVESRFSGSELSFEMSAHAMHSMGLRTRGVVPSPYRLGDVSLYGGWDASAGITASGDTRYETHLLSGVGIAHGLFDIALLTGIGISEFQELAPRASYLPAMLFLQVKQRRLWAQFWARSSWILGSGPRAQTGIDEFALGAQLRLPPLTKWASTFAFEFQRLQDQSLLRFSIGMSFDTFLSD